MKTYDAVNYIHSLSKFGKKSGLDNIRILLEEMGNPQKNLKFVHIAGTNGKGSIASYISSALIENGLKVGLYTSPYIEVFNERIQINNENISDESLIELTEYVQKKVEKIRKKDYNPIEFEVITAISFEYFKRNKCDIVVLETGLGGRLDCTNIIENPLVCIIGAIGFDHTKYLGNTISDIASEKCGIIKKNSYVVMYPKMNPEAEKVVKTSCTLSNSQLCSNSDLKVISVTADGTDFEYGKEKFHLGMIGSHQAYNSVCAIEALKFLKNFYKLNDENIKRGLSKAFWKCRFEVFGEKKDVVIDGAHNFHGIREFVSTANLCFPNKKKIVVMGMLEDKNYEKSLEAICNFADKLIITKVYANRENDETKIFKAAKKLKNDTVLIADNFEAFKTAMLMKNDDCAVFTVGSLYLAGNLRGYVDKFF